LWRFVFLQVYFNLCTDELQKDPNITKCIPQELRLNLMLTISVAALNLVCFPAGIAVDRFALLNSLPLARIPDYHPHQMFLI
jgi:hypothetical protein